MENTKIKTELFGNSIAKRLLICLFKNETIDYAIRIRREIDCSSHSMGRNINKLEETGFLIKTKEGRKNPLRLTKKGKEIAQSLTEIERVLQYG